MARGRKPGSTGRVEAVRYKGIVFRRYPDSERWSDSQYFTPGPKDKQNGVGRLHQEIYKAVHGPIPDGHHVHHADHNPSNNHPDNLVLLPGPEHLSHHAKPGTPEHMEHMRSLAAEWHRSPEGRAWHAEHGRQSWQDRQPITVTCEQCGNSYETRKSGGTRFCSNNCKTKSRKQSGVDDEIRLCAWCGQQFQVDKYAKAATCSRSCGQRRRRAGTG